MTDKPRGGMKHPPYRSLGRTYAFAMALIIFFLGSVDNFAAKSLVQISILRSIVLCLYSISLCIFLCKDVLE